MGGHSNLQIIYLSHYPRDVLPIVRENIKRVYITLNNSYVIFESNIQAYNLAKQSFTKWEQFRNQIEFGIIEVNVLTKNFKIYNSIYNQIFDSNAINTLDPATLVKEES